MGPKLFETSSQLWVFLFTVYGGVVLGALYDLLFILRKLLRAKRILTVLFDIAYWATATALIFALLYYACEGEFRYYDVVGLALGAALWFMGPGRAVRWAQRKISNGIHFIWMKFKGTVVYKFLAK
jgi:spore cortex biosynthesis protein YabQ